MRTTARQTVMTDTMRRTTYCKALYGQRRIIAQTRAAVRTPLRSAIALSVRAAGILIPLLAFAFPNDAYGQFKLDFLLTVGENSDAIQSGTVVAPRFGLGIPTSRDIRVNVEWGLLTTDVQNVDENGIETGSGRETRFLNPYVDVAYSLFVDKRAVDITFGVALGMSFPVADADNAGQTAAYQVALSSAGLWDPWLYLPDTLGFTVPMAVLLEFQDFCLLLDSAVSLLIPTENSDGRSTQLSPQVALEGFAPVGMFDLGTRFQLVQVGDNGDNEGRVHTSIVPFARLFVGPAVIHARFNLNLGTAGGTPFGAAGTWGVSLGLGFQFGK